VSRTYNTRPRWVKLNDPKFPTKERHQHYVVKKEQIGEEEVQLYPWRIDLPVKTYMRPLYRRWSEVVPCTIDIPEVHWMQERTRELKSNIEKLCERRELFTQGCSCCSRRITKQMTNGALRSKVSQAMHSAIRDFGKWEILPLDEIEYNEDWLDVDINPTSKYDSPYWWD
jgi:hypothetical protein